MALAADRKAAHAAADPIEDPTKVPAEANAAAAVEIDPQMAIAPASAVPVIVVPMGHAPSDPRADRKVSPAPAASMPASLAWNKNSTPS